jgi:hypothetical protein
MAIKSSKIKITINYAENDLILFTIIYKLFKNLFLLFSHHNSITLKVFLTKSGILFASVVKAKMTKVGGKIFVIKKLNDKNFQLQN